MITETETASDFLDREFILTREFAAPREVVFKAWTDPGHLAQWWGPKGFTNPVCEWDARPGGDVYVVMRGPEGADFPMGGGFREVITPERLVLTTSALDEQGNPLFEFLHTITFDERHPNTKLTIRSRVIKTTPGAAKYIGGYEAGMTSSLERLTGHLAAKTEPLVVERTFNAPVELVWKALTNREDICRWSFEIKAFEPEVGFEFEFYGGKDDRMYMHRCRVAEVIPQKRLAYSWCYAGYEGDSMVSFDLVADGGKTKVRLTHVGLESFPPISDFARENFVEGWSQLIGSLLKDLVESACALLTARAKRQRDAGRVALPRTRGS